MPKKHVPPCRADRRMPDYRIFQRLHHPLRDTRSFHVTQLDAGRRRTVRSQSLEESILTGADSPESSTRSVAHHV
ncbi:hypothetical protein TNCV_3534051 [Trichonephila clavipes]|nr:hypothetical protein TNCV_3534051 [Trichonephila clavipes]